MTVVARSALVPYTAGQMFALVDRVEDYARFLPWCAEAQVTLRTGEAVEARLHVSYGSLNKWFATRNTRVPGRSIHMSLLEGPFRKLEGEWTFTDLGLEGSKVSLYLEFQFTSRLVGLAVGPRFTQIADSLVDAFSQRAREVYG